MDSIWILDDNPRGVKDVPLYFPCLSRHEPIADLGKETASRRFVTHYVLLLNLITTSGSCVRK